jgi:hypothetical protein
VTRCDPVQGFLALHHVCTRNMSRPDVGRTRCARGTPREHQQQENEENACCLRAGLHQSSHAKIRMASTRIATVSHPSLSM